MVHGQCKSQSFRWIITSRYLFRHVEMTNYSRFLDWGVTRQANCSETALKLLWNCSETDLKVLWNWSEIALKSALKLIENWSKTALKLLWNLLWNCSEITLKLLWNFSKTALKLLWNCSETALKLLWNCSETLATWGPSEVGNTGLGQGWGTLKLALSERATKIRLRYC